MSQSDNFSRFNSFVSFESIMAGKCSYLISCNSRVGMHYNDCYLLIVRKWSQMFKRFVRVCVNYQ